MTQKDEVLALATLSQVRQSQIEEMSFKELDEFVDDGINCLATNEVNKQAALDAMRHAIWRVHDALSCQGRRTDLLDAPEGLTFTQRIKSKAMGVSRATIYRLLADAGMPQKKQLAEGTHVKDVGTGEAGVVVRAHEQDGGVPMVEVRFEGEKKAVTCVAEKLVKLTVRKIARGDLFEDEKGVEYRYEGDGKLVLAEAPLKAGQRKMCRTAKCAKVKACRTIKARQAKAAAAGQSI